MGLAFLQAAFLAGLAAAAIPLVIHLMHRRKSRTIPFPTLRFLREVDVRTARRSQLQEKLVLLVRVAALLLLALALARPVLRGSGVLGRGRASRVIVLDNSLSMEARLDGASALERSRLAALEILQDSGPADRLAVVPLHAPPGGTLALTEDHRAIEDRLLTVRSTALSTPLLEAVATARKLLESDTNPIQEILIFSDLQASASSSAPPPIPMPENIRTVLFVPQRPAASNLAIAEVTPIASGSRKIPLRLRVRNFGGSAGDAAGAEALVRVEVRIDGKTVEERTLRAPPRAETEVRLGPYEIAPGLHEGTLRLGEDILLPDNVHFFCVDVPEAVRVLVAREAPERRAVHEDPAFYIAQALRPAVAQGVLKAKVIATGDLASEDLSAVDGIILAEPARISPAAARALSAFLRKGGGLLFVAGPGQPPEEFRAMASGTAGGEGAPEPSAILPAVLESIVTARDEPFRLKDWKEGHPLWEPLLAASPPVQLGLPRFMAYWKTTPMPGAEVLARFSSGDPALIEASIGRGRSILFASTLRPIWNNFPLKFSFVPFIHSAVRSLARPWRGALRQPIGTPLILRYDADAAPSEVVLHAPEGPPAVLRPRPVTPAGAGAQGPASLTVESAPLETAGLYGVEEKSDGRSDRWAVAVNPDLAESDLAPLSAERIAEIFPSARMVEFRVPSEASRAAREFRLGSELKNPLLFLVLALVLLEPVLANAVAFRRTREAAARSAAAGAASPGEGGRS